ncbi:hypothetical protein C5167_021897 [Papaver somniferum]|uniref:Knottin scorpion toxin-like domain-containing protein n=1 Tax=Papaver somniferum TaxID=3469 RepID=A0A4Y7JKE3_PAPSO|nr:hypothetical protein C5167_021897 [Papaver somniferum]
MVMRKHIILVIAMVMVLVFTVLNLCESALVVELNHCTLAQCVTACKKILENKYISGACMTGNNQGKLCLCLG